MLGSKREYGCSSQHIVMIVINGDFSWDRSAISLGMFGAKSFRSWDHCDKSFFWIDSQPHGTPGQAGQVAVIGTQITQPRAPPPQQAKTGLAGDPRLCHTGVAGSEIPELRENSGTSMISKSQGETEVSLHLGIPEARWGN